MSFWLVDKLPYSLYLQMKDQAVNQGNWRNGNKLDMGSGSNDDVESDFIRRVKQGDVSWICKHCLKRKPCECEKESNGSSEPQMNTSTDALVVE